jgi:antitoxin (DNA-binding transcriptional repressor) of toxin-antitoxin stability system
VGVDVSIADAKNRLTELIRAVEDGEEIVITRHGRPVAQITAPPVTRRNIKWGAMRDRIKFLPGWDEGIDLDRFLAGEE